MIRVYIPASYVLERSYAIHALLTHFLGIKVHIEIDNAINYYVIAYGSKRIIITDSFFGTFPDSADWIHSRNLPSRIFQAESLGLQNILIIYGRDELHLSPDQIKCGVDLFAGTFFMLTRWEESVQVPLDKHERFKASDAALVKAGYILRPAVDEYVALLKSWLTHIGFPFPDSARKFEINPTSDVDIPFYYKGRPAWKIMGGILKRKNISSSWREYSRVRSGNLQDPFNTFATLMELAEEQNQIQTFYFIAGGNTSYENRYSISDPEIISLIKHIQHRGHIIGLHPSYQTFRNKEKIRQEKQRLEEIAGVEITRTRQHFLRFAVPHTWEHLAASGLREDSTMGYAEEPGFRCGTSHSFPVYDLQSKTVLPIMEQPLLVMDVSLKLYKKYTPDEAIHVANSIKDECRKHKGKFTFVWHNSNLSHIDEWSSWQEVLRSLFLH